MPSMQAIAVAQTATFNVSNNGISTEDIGSGRSKTVGSENLSCCFAAEEIDKRARLAGVATAPHDRDRVTNRRCRRDVERNLHLVAHNGGVRRVNKARVG